MQDLMATLTQTLSIGTWAGCLVLFFHLGCFYPVTNLIYLTHYELIPLVTNSPSLAPRSLHFC